MFCSAHADKVESHLQTTNCTRTVKIQCITSTQCSSAGDAIRELDVKHVIRSDPFVLISGDVISNVNLRPVIERHKERKKKDSSSIMTMLYKKQSVTSPLRALDSDLVVAIDTENDQVVLYDDYLDQSHVEFPTVFFKEHSAIKFHYDLLDCHIDLCSPDILVQFSDNFDYLNIRRDFVANEVQNYELGNKLHAEIIIKEYAARVHDPRTYHSVCMDILERWTYPMVPDNNFLDTTSYSHRRHGMYKESNVTVARSTKIGENTMIGSGSVLEKHSQLSRGIIGRNCSIGQGVTITGSCLWDNVTVEPNVTIRDSIICDNVVIKQGAIIERGCILSFGVVIGENCHVKEFSKITTEGKVFDGFSDDEQDEMICTDDSTVVGEHGQGRMWTLEEEEFSDCDIEDPNELQVFQMRQLKSTLLGCSEVLEERAAYWDEYDGSSSSDGDDSVTDFEIESPQARFMRVVSEMVVSGDKSAHDLDNIFLEIKSFKFAQDRSFVDCIEAIVPTLMSIAQTDQTNSMEILSRLKQKIEKWTSVLKRCIMGRTEELCMLTAVEKYTLKDENRALIFPIFRYLLQILYDADLTQEETILQWAKDTLHRDLPQDPQVAEFIEWLQEDSDSESDDSE